MVYWWGLERADEYSMEAPYQGSTAPHQKQISDSVASNGRGYVVDPRVAGARRFLLFGHGAASDSFCLDFLSERIIAEALSERERPSGKQSQELAEKVLNSSEIPEKHTRRG